MDGLFEREYRISEGDDVLAKENSIHRSIDLRLVAIELLAEGFRKGNRVDVDALLRTIDQTLATRAADFDALLDAVVGSIAPAVIATTPAARFTSDVEVHDLRSDAIDGDVATLAASVDHAEAVRAALLTAIALASVSDAEAGSAKTGFMTPYLTRRHISGSIVSDETGTIGDALRKKLDSTGLSQAKAKARSGTIYAQVERPIEAFFGDMVNLADEGALGNDLDVAANDTAIAKALDRCRQSSARPMLAPPGMYRANPFAITQSGVKLVGLGEGASIFRPQADGDFISLGSLQTITRQVGVEKVGGLYNTKPAPGSSFIHVHGASQVQIDRVQCGDPAVNGSGGGHVIVVDNYGNGAQINLQNITGVNYAGDGIGIGPLSRHVPNEIHVSGKIAFSRGNRGLVAYFVSGLYVMGGAVSLYQMASQGVCLIPGLAQPEQYPGMDPATYPQNIYGADLIMVNADTCGASGFYLGGPGAIGDLLMVDCIASSCMGHGFDATDPQTTIDGWTNLRPRATLNAYWGKIVNSPKAKNWSALFGEFWLNNTLDGSSGGIAAGNGTSDFDLIGNKSGWGGWVGRTGSGLVNRQRFGGYIDASCDRFIAALNRFPGNVTAALQAPSSTATKLIFGNL